MNELKEWHGVSLEGIEFTYPHKTQCPKCASEGGDRSGDNLHVYGLDDDGRSLGGWCFKCNWGIPSEEFLAEIGKDSFNTVKEIEYMTTEFKMSFWDTIKDDCSLDGKGFRGIPKEVYTKYKVYHEFDENSGEVTKQHYPITKNNEVVGIKTRLVPKDFRSIGETGKNCQLFGTNSFKSSSKRAICIASGECDAMAAYAMFLENSKSRGYDPIPVVSGTIGENCATQLRNNYEWLNSFEKIYLIPDNDEAGKKVIPNLVDALPKGKVYIIELTSEKDSNDMLVKGKQKEFMNKFFEAKLYTPTGIVSSESVYDEIVKRAETDKLPFPPEFEKLNKALAGGIPFGFIVNILAGSGIGKSSFLNQVTTYYTKVCNERVGVVTLEADAGAYGENLLSYYCKRKISLIENRDEKIEFLKSDYVKKCAKDLFIREDGTPSFYLLDDRGDFDKLQDKIEELIIGFGVRVILIDVISDVFSGMSLEQVDKWMQWEKNLVKRFNCIIIQVAHVRKAGSGQKSASEGAKLTEEQLIGSGTQYRSAGINLALVRDKNAEDETVRNTTEVYLLKSRDTGITGKIMELYYDIDTHSLDDKDEYFKKRAESVVENLNTSDNVEW